MIQINANEVRYKIGDEEKVYAIPEILEMYAPFAGAPIEERNAAMKQLIYFAEELYADLSDTARLRYDFWKQIVLSRIVEEKFIYQVKISKTYKWELTINQNGLYYKDVSGLYCGTGNKVSEQLLSDFWFYGPLLPLPDLDTRKWIVAKIRNAFMQAGSSASYKHFPLFDYPKQTTSPFIWETGDAKASDFVIAREFGIEIGRTTWYDGLVYSKFVSFEHFVTLPSHHFPHILPDVHSSIKDYLAPALAPIDQEAIIKARDEKTPFGPIFSTGQTYPEREELIKKYEERTVAESKRLFMNNGGQTHYIYLDGDGNNYHATAAQEAEWRKELLEIYENRLKEENQITTLQHLARGMKYNGATNLEPLLLQLLQNATAPSQKIGYALALTEVSNNAEGANMLIALLHSDTLSGGEVIIFFENFKRMYHHAVIQNFIFDCLQGDNELWFGKALAVLKFWSKLTIGAAKLKPLFDAINWDNATSADPDFRRSLKRIIGKMKNEK